MNHQKAHRSILASCIQPCISLYITAWELHPLSHTAPVCALLLSFRSRAQTVFLTHSTFQALPGTCSYTEAPPIQTRRPFLPFSSGREETRNHRDVFCPNKDVRSGSRTTERNSRQQPIAAAHKAMKESRTREAVCGLFRARRSAGF